VGTLYTKTFTIWGILTAAVLAMGFGLWRFYTKQQNALLATK
jgi:hypothetical protein